jgi:hypothetical protein
MSLRYGYARRQVRASQFRMWREEVSLRFSFSIPYCTRAAAHTNPVRSGDIGYTCGPKRFSSGCKVFSSRSIYKIVIHKTDQPNAVVNFFDPDGFPCERCAEVDLLVHAETSATGDHDRAVVEGIVRLGNAAIGAGISRVDVGWAFRGEDFMRPLVIDQYRKYHRPHF